MRPLIGTATVHAKPRLNISSPLDLSPFDAIDIYTGIRTEPKILFIVKINKKNFKPYVCNVKDIIDEATLGLTYSGASTPANSPLDSSDEWDFNGMPVASTAGGLSATVMAHGVVVLDNYMFLGYKESAKIYGSS